MLIVWSAILHASLVGLRIVRMVGDGKKASSLFSTRPAYFFTVVLLFV